MITGYANIEISNAAGVDVDGDFDVEAEFVLKEKSERKQYIHMNINIILRDLYHLNFFHQRY